MSSVGRCDDDIYFKHVVKKNETIGEILFGYEIGPLWGKGRKVEQLTHLNSLKVADSGHFVREGTLLLIPKEWFPLKGLSAIDQWLKESGRAPAEVKKAIITSQAVEVVTQEESESSEKSSQSNALVTTDPEEEEFEGEFQKFTVWAGSGMNLLQYGQSFSSGSSVNFSSIVGPSLYLGAQVRLSKTIGVRSFFKDSPGEGYSSDEVQVRNGKYRWQTLSMEGVYYFPTEDHSTEYFGLLGFQHHRVPFIDVINSSTIDIIPKLYNLLSLGVGGDFFKKSKIQLEAFIRYQLMLSSSSTSAGSFSAQQVYSFDGSLGLYRAFEGGFRFGLFWYGQAQKFKYKTRFSNATDGSGDQDLFFSNIELRGGYDL